MNLVEAIDLYKSYDEKTKEKTYAVEGVTLAIKQGETLGLVGESGCGKSTFGKLLLQLEKKTSGKVRFKGEQISNYGFGKMRPIRKNIQMIFQNSANLFNPYFTVKQILMEPVNNYFHQESEADKKKRITTILRRVGLDESYLNRFGNELSGGEQQRIGIARALVLNPEFIVCDEVVSSVDYTIRNQILELLMKLKEQFGLTYLFISHDLSAVQKVCDRVAVMYMGKVMEILPSIKAGIKHPYTKSLLAATLDGNPRNRDRNNMAVHDISELAVPDTGCPYRNRCPLAEDICKKQDPQLKNVNDKHAVACHVVAQQQLDKGGIK